MPLIEFPQSYSPRALVLLLLWCTAGGCTDASVAGPGADAAGPSGQPSGVTGGAASAGSTASTGGALQDAGADGKSALDASSTTVAPPTCANHTVSVRLAADAADTYSVVGEMCRNDDPGQPLLLLVSGAGYGPAYWDFPHEPETYSFLRAAHVLGLATFNLSRIGIGESDHPDSALLDVDSNAHVLHEVVTFVRESLAFTGPVVAVGHSLGSVTSLATAIHHPADFDGLLLTGFIHNRNPAFGATLANASYSALMDPKFAAASFDTGYQTTKPGGRVAFYVETNTDPQVIAVDDETKETLTLSEALTLRDYYDDQSLQVAVPVMLVEGDQDLLGCNEDVVCATPGVVAAHEAPYWSAATCLEVDVVDNTGHNLNLHRNAQATFARMFDWLSRRFGSGSARPATDPCPG